MVRLSDSGELANFEFIDRTPTTEDVVALLETLDPVWGVSFTEIAPWVQGLPSTKKIKKKVEGKNIESWHEVTTLYVAVAGRVHMARLAAERHNWRIDFEPEPVTPTGVPGMLQMDDRIVYREYCSIYDVENDTFLGRKPGMAWVPASGGRQAAGSNPYEKVETAARGRSLAAWGFGVLPGSGIASLEEMLGVPKNRDSGPTEEMAKKSPEERMEEVMLLIEKVRQAREKSLEQMFTEISDYAQKSFGVDIVMDRNDEHEVTQIDLTQLKPGQVILLGSALTQTLKSIAKAETL
jgi:hypothetical protein